jgi:hypothetical protein
VSTVAAYPLPSNSLVCLNCGHQLAKLEKFCSECDQPTKIKPPTMWEFLREWLLTYVTLEGKLWLTLWAILTRPGHLTVEYPRGRRRRYVQPLRLLLTIGFLFFLSVRFGVNIESELRVDATSAPETAMDATTNSGLTRTSGIWLPESLGMILPDHVQREIDAVNMRARTDPETELRRLGQAMLSLAPYAVLLSIPVFACLLKLLFWQMPYGGHFVFALHLHAAWYGLMF